MDFFFSYKYNVFKKLPEYVWNFSFLRIECDADLIDLYDRLQISMEISCKLAINRTFKI